MNTFLTDTEMASLVEAIQTAEDCSTGEIRIHIDSNTEGNNAEMAFEVFRTLCKDKTAAQNGVLFHVNFERKYLTIIGDEGIHKKVHQSACKRKQRPNRPPMIAQQKDKQQAVLQQRNSDCTRLRGEQASRPRLEQIGRDWQQYTGE